MSIFLSNRSMAGCLAVSLAAVLTCSCAAGAEAGTILADQRVEKTLAPLVAEYNRIWLIRNPFSEHMAACCCV
jgi:hypothetical protein